MSETERNRTLAERWFQEVWNDRRDEVIDEIMAPDCTGHMEGVGAVGREKFRESCHGLLAAFPDLSVEVVRTVAEGSHVVVDWILRATHTGDGLGIPATGRPAEVHGLTWLTFADGALVSGRDSWNQGALMAALTAT